jgi:hypothetical protein
MNQLTDYITVFKEGLSIENCDYIIDTLKESDLWIPTLTSDDIQQNRTSSDYRVCETIPISETKSLKNVDDILYSTFSKCIKNYSKIHKKLLITKDLGYHILRYNEGGKYGIHVDDYVEEHRMVSFVSILNDGYEGGELKFFGEYTPSLEKGDIIAFPSSFMYPHEVTPVTSGVRYSIVTWFV